MGSESYIISGGRPLSGAVTVSGAKNSALKLMAASLLTSDPVRLENVPDIEDVRTMAELLTSMGAVVDLQDGVASILCPDELMPEAPYELVRRMRASIIVMGPLLARFARARVALPGGCNIGSRKIDQHMKGLEAMGAEIRSEHGFIEARGEGLKGALIVLDFPSVGATENVLMASVLASGRTVLENAAREPEIVDLAGFLRAMGAQIEGDGGSTITIDGVEGLNGTDHAVIPDRIEAGTWLIAGAASGGTVTVRGCRLDHLDLAMDKLEHMGVSFQRSPDEITVRPADGLRATDVSTMPYPGFASDLQPPLAALMSIAEGTSIITENIFENRFIYVDELIRMGADIRVEGHHAMIRGVRGLWGVPVKAPDLRAGAALVIAALAAEGETEIGCIHHIERGYERLEDKLRGLGAVIERIAV